MAGQAAVYIGKLELAAEGAFHHPGAFALGAVALALFVWWELRLQRRGGDPLFDFTLLRFRSFRFGLITVSIVALGEFGLVLVLSLFLQSVRGLTAFQTGLTLLPFALLTLVVAPTAGILSGRFGPKWVVTAGMLIEAIAIFALSRALSVTAPLAALVGILMLYGVGVGLAIAHHQRGAERGAVQPVGGRLGANNTIRQLGVAMGIAIIGAVLTSTLATSATTQLQASQAVPSFVKTAIIQALEKSGGAGEGATLQGLRPASTKPRPARRSPRSSSNRSWTAHGGAGWWPASSCCWGRSAPFSSRTHRNVARGGGAREIGRGGELMYHKIVVPLYGSMLAEEVLAHVRVLAHCMGSEVVLMRVMAYPSYDYLITDPELSVALREEMEMEACNYLEPLADVVEDEGIRASADATIVKGPIADAIIDFAHEKGADLIAMSTHGRTGPSRWFLGSVADRVVRGAGVPVLLVRPGQQEVTEGGLHKLHSLLHPFAAHDESEGSLRGGLQPLKLIPPMRWRVGLSAMLRPRNDCCLLSTLHPHHRLFARRNAHALHDLHRVRQHLDAVDA